MKLITNEYTTLINLDGGDNIIIKPNAEFNPIQGRYKATSSAYIRNAETQDIVVYLNPGDIVESIGEAPKKKAKKQAPQESLLEE